MRLLAANNIVRQSGSRINTEQFHTCAIAMPKLNSKLSRKLANVKEQLKKGTTRGRCPRPLAPEEIRNLEARRKELQEAMVNARFKDREDPVVAAPTTPPLPESENGGSVPQGEDEEEDSVAVVLPAPPQKEETVAVRRNRVLGKVSPAPPQEDDAQETDKLMRLLAIVQQLQALFDVSSPLANFARAQLEYQQHSLLENWPLGQMRVPWMTLEAKCEHEGKKMKEKAEKQDGADPATKKTKLMSITWTLEGHEVMQPFQDEYLRAKKSAFEAIASLQRLSLEVQEQRMAATAELEGWGFHERFICVRNEWLRQFRACCAEELLDTAWLRQCARQADLDNEDCANALYGRQCEHLTGVLSWSPPFGVQE